eukprot:scaffold8481_cov286-Pinguiococcus_pyrenoidosus.AAC.2
MSCSARRMMHVLVPAMSPRRRSSVPILSAPSRPPEAPSIPSTPAWASITPTATTALSLIPNSCAACLVMLPARSPGSRTSEPICSGVRSPKPMCSRKPAFHGWKRSGASSRFLFALFQAKFHLHTTQQRERRRASPVRRYVRKSVRSKNFGRRLHSSGLCFLSHSSLGSSISGLMRPPTASKAG